MVIMYIIGKIPTISNCMFVLLFLKANIVVFAMYTLYIDTSSRPNMFATYMKSII